MMKEGKQSKATSPIQEERRRTRRSYSCGPCKRFKMKCNMELPCRLCVLAKREQECHLLPPNPPSEEEKNRTARRRLRNLRRQEMEQQKQLRLMSLHMNHGPLMSDGNGVGLSSSSISTGTSFSVPNSGPIPSSNSRHHVSNQSLTPALTSPSNPLVASQNSSRSLLMSLHSEHNLGFYSEDHLHQVPARKHMNVNINHYQFCRDYFSFCKSISIPMPVQTLMRWKSVVTSVSRQLLALFFRKHYFLEDGGVHEVMDLNTMLAVANNILDQFPSLNDNSNWSVDKYLLQQMSFVCIIISKGEALEGSSERARQWLAISSEIKDMLAPFVLLGDCIFLSQWIIQSKLAYVLLNSMHEYAVLFESYLAAVLLCEDFVNQLRLTEQNGPDSEEFTVCARLWVIIKITECEVSILQSKAGLQNRFPSLVNTIVPDRLLISRVYNLDFTQTATDYTPFNVALIASFEFFRLFEQATLPRDVIFLYLSLYGNVHRKFQVPLNNVVNLLSGNIDMALITQHSEDLITCIISSFLLIRWLSIVQADSPHFPSLRFAYYLSTMMTMFNSFNDIDDKLCLPPGALLDTLMRGSNLFLILQVYNTLCHQAIFAAVLSCFVRPDSHMRTLDLAYVFHVVMKSLSRTVEKMRVATPFSSILVINSTIQAIDILYNMANDPNFIASSPEQFMDLLLANMPGDIAASFVNFVFGNTETFLNHLKQLWRLRDHVDAHGHEPIPITSTLILNTEFLRQFDSSYLPFAYTQDVVNEYMVVVVDGHIYI